MCQNVALLTYRNSICFSLSISKSVLISFCDILMGHYDLSSITNPTKLLNQLNGYGDLAFKTAGHSLAGR